MDIYHGEHEVSEGLIKNSIDNNNLHELHVLYGENNFFLSKVFFYHKAHKGARRLKDLIIYSFLCDLCALCEKIVL